MKIETSDSKKNLFKAFGTEKGYHDKIIKQYNFFIIKISQKLHEWMGKKESETL